MSEQPDLFKLAAEARPLMQQLHQRQDVVVQFKSDDSGYEFDRLSNLEREATDHPGNFTLDNKFITLNLDALISDRRPMPESLAELDDVRKHPVLAGVMAHSSAHARYSKWSQDPSLVPSQLHNPDFDPEHPTPEKDYSIEEDDGSITVEQHPDDQYRGPEFFPVSEKGRLMEIAGMTEEARIERLGMKTFSRTWRESMKYSSTYLTLESMDEGDALEESALDAALRTMILVGGRTVAGTLGFDERNRKATAKVLGNAQKVIETALAEKMAEDPSFDPFHEVMSIISDEVFNNDHEGVESHLNNARRILEIIHPEDKENPDNPGASQQQGAGGAPQAQALAAGMGPGEGGSDEDDDEPVSGNSKPEDGEGEGKGDKPEPTPEQQALQDALDEMQSEMEDALNDLAAQIASDVEQEERRVDEELDDEDGTDSYGAVRSKNEKPPHIDRYEEPTSADRDLYNKTLLWLQNQSEPTVTEFDRGQWMPGGGSRFDARNWTRDQMSDRKATDRTDWIKTTEVIKTAPPVLIGLMLDGSGSMSSRARHSASVAWAAANAAAMLPESKVVSLVFGHDALLTQSVEEGAPKQVAVAKNNAGWENFAAGAKMLEDMLGLSDPSMDEGNPHNVLNIIVSDLMYGGQGQPAAFNRITKEWAERGFRTLVIGARKPNPGQPPAYGISHEFVELVEAEDLFQ